MACRASGRVWRFPSCDTKSTRMCQHDIAATKLAELAREAARRSVQAWPLALTPRLRALPVASACGRPWLLVNKIFALPSTPPRSSRPRSLAASVASDVNRTEKTSRPECPSGSTNHVLATCPCVCVCVVIVAVTLRPDGSGVRAVSFEAT